MNDNKRKILAILVTVVLFILVLCLRHAIISGFRGGEPGSSQGSPGERPPAVETVNAVETDISDYLALTGTVESYRVARLASPAEGPVKDIRVREGDTVGEGEELLFIGRKRGVDALVESLRVALEKASDELVRTRGLVEQDALPGEAIDEARAAYEKARAELARAEEIASDHVIAAPWAGIVRDVLVREGGFVSSHTALLEIYDPASLVIRAGIPEQYAGAVTAGMQAEIRLDARRGETVKGRVERLYPYLDAGLRTRIA